MPLRIVGGRDGLGDTDMLNIGAKGSNVMQIQTILTGNGYPTGGIDGIFGEKTKQAIITFQSSQGLTPDGIVGPQTWGALMKLAKPVGATAQQTQMTKAPATVPVPAPVQDTPWSTYLPFIILIGVAYFALSDD